MSKRNAPSLFQLEALDAAEANPLSLYYNNSKRKYQKGGKMTQEDIKELRKELETPRKWPIVLLDDDNEQYNKLWDWLLKEAKDADSSNLG